MIHNAWVRQVKPGDVLRCRHIPNAAGIQDRSIVLDVKLDPHISMCRFKVRSTSGEEVWKRTDWFYPPNLAKLNLPQAADFQPVDPVALTAEAMRGNALQKLKEAELAMQQFVAYFPEARRTAFDMDIRNLRTSQGWVKAAVMTDEVTA